MTSKEDIRQYVEAGSKKFEKVLLEAGGGVSDVDTVKKLAGLACGAIVAGFLLALEVLIDIRDTQARIADRLDKGDLL